MIYDYEKLLTDLIIKNTNYFSMQAIYICVYL